MSPAVVLAEGQRSKPVVPRVWAVVALAAFAGCRSRAFLVASQVKQELWGRMRVWVWDYSWRTALALGYGLGVLRRLTAD